MDYKEEAILKLDKYRNLSGNQNREELLLEALVLSNLAILKKLEPVIVTNNVYVDSWGDAI